MSDLYIEARLQAIKDIASASCSDEKDADNIANFCDEIYSAIPKLDKIISQLGDYGNEEIEYYRNTPYENCIRECVSKAIEIVKQGGDADDNCKWSQISTARYETSCGYKLVEFFDTNACYCKQCGKKIKVIQNDY